MDEQIGVLSLKPDPMRPLTENDKKLVAAVANQVAQQVENIRLLADASRARAEAEEANRRMTHESWQSFNAYRREDTLGFVYDTVQVTRLGDSSLPGDIAFTVPLTVRGEAIGQLAVTGEDKPSPEALELATAIAAQTSTHLENLRLSEQNEKRARELETVAEVSVTASTTLVPDTLLQSVVDRTKERFGLYHAHIYVIDELQQTLQLRAGAGDVGRRLVADNWKIPLDHPTSIAAKTVRYRNYIIANDLYRDKNTAFLSNNLLPDTRSEMAVPMIVGDKLLGVFDVQSDKANYFSEVDAHIYTTLASQVAVALQNARLYAEQATTVAQLQELDRLKSGFLANMSHELRTPLNSIIGFSDVMLMELDGPLTPHMSTDLKLIQKNGQHLLHLINDVLDMAKIESGRMNLNPDKFGPRCLPIRHSRSIASLLRWPAKGTSRYSLKSIQTGKWKSTPITPACAR
jgi:K+-sensing histidine kinase KdpD